MGRKQSPFIGRRVPLVDNGVPILYQRYTDVSEILLEGSDKTDKKRAAPEPNGTDAAAAAAADEGAADAAQPAAKKSKKDKQSKQQQQKDDGQANGVPAAAAAAAAPTPAAAADGEAEERPLTKLEKRQAKQLRKRLEREAAAAAAAAAAGEDGDAGQQPGNDSEQQQQQQQLLLKVAEAKGNAEEAARIRQVLGFTAAAAAGDGDSDGDGDVSNGQQQQQQQPSPAAAAPAAAAAPKATSGGFAFNFSNLASTEEAVAADTEAKLAAIVAVDSADKDGFVPRRVFVGGMPYSYSQEQIEEYWTWCGPIEELDLMTFPDTGRFRGIAFITFKTQEGADAALACDGEQLDGQTLKVERCKAAAVAKTLKASAASARQQQQSQRGRQSYNQQQQQTPGAEGARGGVGAAGEGPTRTPGYNVAYVGNIAFEARPEDISALFEACNVTKVRLHTDKDTRKSKGYAHVHFADEEGLVKAISMTGTQLMGRGIKVSYGQPKKN